MKALFYLTIIGIVCFAATGVAAAVHHYARS